MSPLIIGIVIVLIFGIIYLSSDNEKNDERQRHLKALVKLLEAEMEEIPGRKNSFVLQFTYRKVPFFYEDIEESIFEKVAHHGFLRMPLPINFNIVFTEDLKNAFRSAHLAPGLVSSDTNSIESPHGFKEFHIFSNKPKVAEELFNDDAVVRVFSRYKSRDLRGKPQMALEVVDGVLIQKFYSLGHQLEPSIFDLRKNTSKIMDFLEDMLIIYRQVKKISESGS
ncbi:MAG: hypothetical protein AB1650_02475 [Candidatus Omnitrophota bacterium]